VMSSPADRPMEIVLIQLVGLNNPSNLIGNFLHRNRTKMYIKASGMPSGGIVSFPILGQG
jgi:hypothetical protein